MRATSGSHLFSTGQTKASCATSLPEVAHIQMLSGNSFQSAGVRLDQSAPFEETEAVAAAGFRGVTHTGSYWWLVNNGNHSRGAAMLESEFY